MSLSKNQKIIDSFKNEITIQEYAKAYQIFDARRGLSMGKEWKSSVFFILSLAMLFFLLMENFNFEKIPVVTIVFLISMYMCTHYIYMLPKKAKLMGEHIYKSSKLLSKPYEIEIYRDCFVIKNKYEYLMRYYTELTDCVETDEIFVLIGGFERKICVISKKSLTNEQIEIISNHFKQEMISKYRKMKNSSKKDVTK